MSEIAVADLRTADDFRRHAKALRERRKMWAARSAPTPEPQPVAKIIWDPQFSFPLPQKEIVARYLAWLEQADETAALPPAPSVEKIIRVVGTYFVISANDILSQTREARVTRPRQVAMWLARKLTPRSMPEIGRYIGGRDHTTVLHAVRKVNQVMEADPAFKADVDELVKRLGGIR